MSVNQVWLKNLGKNKSMIKSIYLQFFPRKRPKDFYWNCVKHKTSGQILNTVVLTGSRDEKKLPRPPSY